MSQVGTWIMTVMNLVQVVLPLIPFCSIFIALASESGSSLLDGWLLTANVNAAYGALQMGCEAIESAAGFDAIDMERVKQEG